MSCTGSVEAALKETGEVVLLHPERSVPNGAKLG